MKKYLLDTHILLWIFQEPHKISANVQSVLKDDSNILTYSAISLQEISIKAVIGRLDLKGHSPEDIRLQAIRSDFDELVISGNLTTSLYQLSTKSNHRDPFDRLLIWQAIKGDFTLISADKKFLQYECDGLKLLQN